MQRRMTRRKSLHEGPGRAPMRSLRAGPNRWTPWIAWIPWLFVLVAPTSLSAAPNLKFHPNNNKVRVTGVVIGGDVLFLSDSHQLQDWTRSVVSRIDFRLGNSKGVAVLKNVSVVDPSIWAAVDLSTGGFDVDSPSGQYQAIVVNEGDLFNGNDIAYDGERLDLVVIRGKSVWHARAHDGGGNDRSPSPDAQVEIAFESLNKVFPVGSVPEAELYDGPQVGDLVIGIDADQMVYFTVIVVHSK